MARARVNRTVVRPAPHAVVRAILRAEATKAGLGLTDLLGAKRGRNLAAARRAALQRLLEAFPAKSAAEARKRRGHNDPSRSSPTPATPAAKRRDKACDRRRGRQSPSAPRVSGLKPGSRLGRAGDERFPSPAPAQAAPPAAAMTGLAAAAERPWTPAMTAFLLRMRREGKSFGWIAKALGVSRSVAIGRATKRTLACRWRARTRVTQEARADEPAPLGPPRALLAEGRCRWIAGDIADADWRMCGHPCVHARPWCAHHVARVFEPVKENGGQRKTENG